jgi:GNAT superfamily N-acetyltransferase
MTRLEPASLAIRQPVAEDAPHLAALSSELGYPATAAEIAGRLAGLLERADHCLRGVQSPSGDAIGWIHAHEQCILESDPWCEIAGLVIHASHRGRGAGRALVAEVEAWAKSRRLEVIKVRSNVVREESHPFYQRLGFARIKTQHVYRKRLG